MSPEWSEKSHGKTPKDCGQKEIKCQSHYNNINVQLKVLKSCYFSSASCTSICIFRWTLKCDSKVRKMASDNSKTSGTDETPFLDSATHRYCLMALTNISWVRKTGPAPCSTESSSCRETILDRNSWDLQGQRSCTVCASVTPFNLLQRLCHQNWFEANISRKKVT